jgi:hypothetical protein
MARVGFGLNRKVALEFCQLLANHRVMVRCKLWSENR